MKSSFRQIFEGWRNKYIPPAKMKEHIAEVATSRLETCRNCYRNSSGIGNNINILSTCLECGCPLLTKTACLSCECPLKKWTAVLNKTQESRLKEKINDSPQPRG